MGGKEQNTKKAFYIRHEFGLLESVNFCSLTCTCLAYSPAHTRPLNIYVWSERVKEEIGYKIDQLTDYLIPVIVENFIFVSHHCALKSPVFSKQTFSVPILVDCVDERRDSLTPRSPNISFYKSTHVTVLQYGNNNRLNFNHILICGTCLFSLLPIISHVITLLVISSLTRINNNCWKLCFLI